MKLDTHVGHGYTLDDLDRFARTAVRRDITRSSWRGSGIEERFDIAWSAIAAAVAEAEERPTETALMAAGLRALNETVGQHLRHHGGRDNARAFNAYWLDLGSPTGSPEGAVVEVLALAQIWPRLMPREKDVLTALAAYDDHSLAAASLGMTKNVYATQLSLARRRFLALWHEGEIASRPWGNDRRRKPGARHQSMATRLKKGRTGRKRPEPVHGKATTYRNHKCRCEPCATAARREQQEYRARVAAKREAA